MKMILKRIWFTLTHPGWHRLDRLKPYYHEPCDVTELLYGFGKYELGSAYEFSLLSNTTYEGFVSDAGLFVSTPKNTYWHHSSIAVINEETLAVHNNRYWHFEWGSRS